MDKYTRIFYYNYPRDLVYYASVNAVRKDLTFKLIFNDKKAGFIGFMLTQSPYITYDSIITLSIRDDNKSKTDVIIKNSNKRDKIPYNYKKIYNKYILRLNRRIIKYLQKLK